MLNTNNDAIKRDIIVELTQKYDVVPHYDYYTLPVSPIWSWKKKNKQIIENHFYKNIEHFIFITNFHRTNIASDTYLLLKIISITTTPIH